jgi:CheY-like chemotaxis protein
MPGESVLVIDDSPTILRVVQLVLAKAGFDVRTALDGEVGIELAREKRPDLILLDFVMPKMNGYQVCKALAIDPELREVPVVLMSAKGDQVGERFVKVMGIVDYITKPFVPEAITAVVSHTIGKHAQISAVSNALVESTGESSLVDDPASDEPQPRRLLRSALRDAIVGAVGGALAQGGEVAEGDVPERVRQALDDRVVDEVVAGLRKAAPEIVLEADAVLAGDLRVVPIAEVLHLLQVQTQTGVLAVTRARGSVELYFRNGRLDLALAVGLPDEFLLGRFVIENQLMTDQDLELFLSSRTGGKLLGRQLVKLGYISEAELKQVITQQTSELIYEILRWNFGRFTFRATKDLPAVAVDASLGLSVEGVLMEGFRRVDEWHLIEREIDNFDVVFLRNEDALAQMGRGRLTREELSVLELVNGKHSVKEIVRQSRMGSFEVSKMLYRLLSIKLLRKRVMPVAV